MTANSATTIASLQSLAGPFSNGDVAVVAGYYAPGDLGGGSFYFESAPPAAATVTGATGVSLSITGATNSSPISITTALHSYTSGQVVTIAGVGGNTAANGTWEISVTSTTTFTLNGSTGNAAYTLGGTSKTTTVTTSADHGLVSGQRAVIAGVGGNTSVNGAWTITSLSGTTLSIGAASNAAYTSGGFIGDGGTAIPSSATSGRWCRVNYDIFDVRRFGAKGDCNGLAGTDDSPAFASAIAAGQRHYALIYGVGLLYGGLSVLVPAGSYYLKKTIKLPDRCSLIGTGSPWTSALFFDTAPSPTASPWGDGILIDQGASNYSTNAQIKGLLIANVRQGTASYRAQNGGSGIELIGTANIKISDLIIMGFKRGITLDTSNDVAIERVTFGGTSLSPYTGYPKVSEGPYDDDVGLWCASCGFQATYTTVGANYGTLSTGDTLVLGFDLNVADFTTTFAAGDTVGTVVSKINAAANFAYSDTFVYASNVGGQIQLKSKQFGMDKSQIRVISGAALIKLGFQFAVSVVGAGANYPSLVDGDTLVLNIDGVGAFTTTFTAAQGAHIYPPGGPVVAAITAAANSKAGNFFPYVSLVGGQVRIASKLAGATASVQVVSGTAVTKLGLTVGTTTGAGGVVYGTGNGHGTEVMAASGLVNGVFVKECQLGGTTNVWQEDGFSHVFENCNVEGGRIARITYCVNSTWRNIESEGTPFGELFMIDGAPYNMSIENCLFQGYSSTFSVSPGTSMLGFTDSGRVRGLSIKDIFLGTTGPDLRPAINTIEFYPGSGNTINVLSSCNISNVVGTALGALIGHEPVDCSVSLLGTDADSRGMLGVGTAKPAATLDIGPPIGYSSPLASFQIRTDYVNNTPAVFVSTDFSRHEHGLGRVNYGGLIQQGVVEYFAKGDIGANAADLTFEYERADQAAFDVEVDVVTHCYGSASGKRWKLKRFGVTFGSGDVVLDSSTAEDTSRVINAIGSGLVFNDPTIDVNPGTHKIRVALKATTGANADILRYLVYTKMVVRSVY